MLRRAEPTGRWRHRTHRDWRGRETLVLQIEERGFHTSYIGGHIDTERVTRWRDATAGDVMVTVAHAAIPQALREAA